MKLGVIARCDNRGLGNQCLEVCRNLDPERVLVVLPPEDGRFTQHPERYDQWDTTVLDWQGGRLDEPTVKAWLSGLDVVYTAETTYDHRLARWAQALGVGVVVHANPEFLWPQLVGEPVTWWSATPWRLPHLPPCTRVVPMPVATPQVTHQPAPRFRLLHVAGWPAVGDRNGTNVVVETAALMRSDCDLIVRGQHRDIARLRRPAGPVRMILEAGNVANYWDLYRDADVIVLPRRFGGLCLVAQEAMAAGLPAVMPDASPNEIWPGPRVPTRTSKSVHTPGGNIPLHDTDPGALAATLDDLAANPGLVAKLRREAGEWFEANTWDALRATWLDELDRVS